MSTNIERINVQKKIQKPRALKFLKINSKNPKLSKYINDFSNQKKEIYIKIYT